MATFDLLVSTAQEAFATRAAGVAAVNKTMHPGSAEYRAAVDALPKARVRCGNVEAEVFQPQNRMVFRRAHLKTRFWVAGQRTSASAVAAALDGGR